MKGSEKRWRRMSLLLKQGEEKGLYNQVFFFPFCLSFTLREMGVFVFFFFNMEYKL